MNINEIFQWITHPHFPGILALKIFFLLISGVLFIIVIIDLIKTKWFKYFALWDMKEFFTSRPYFGMKKWVRHWEKIKERLDSGLESDAKLSLLEADSMLNDVLKNMGYEGNNLTERLEKLTTGILPNLDEVLEAHKIRNNVVHDPSYKIEINEIKKILDIYEKAFVSLDVL